MKVSDPCEGQPLQASLHPDLKAFGDAGELIGCSFVACIPARNEEAHIARSLSALDADLDRSDGVVLVANGCRDATTQIALRVMSGWQRPWLLVDCHFREGLGTAPLARRLAFDVAADAAPCASLFSTDADTVVLPGLRAAYAADLARGFDLVCGRIGFLPEEASLLPAADPASQALVREYRQTSREIAALLCPDPDNPWPNHGNIGGANFAIAAGAYRKAGPLPTPPSGEDRALRRRCEALGMRIRYADEPIVHTSCRLDGRARGGLADELARDRLEEDPVVDELLEPADALVLRLRARAAYLGAPSRQGRSEALGALTLDPADAARLAAQGGPLAWQEAEDLSPRLRRTRLRLSDLRRLIPALRLALDEARGAPFDSRASREPLR